MDGEGHFLALLGKKGQPSKRENSAQLHKVQKIPAEALEFLSHVGRSFAPDRLYLAKDALYYLPEGMPVLKGIRYLRTGLLLGTIGKNRFEPSQALAAYLKKEEFDRYLDFSSDDPRVIKYLKGETLDVSDRLPAGQKGWILIGTDGHPLGWGKLANGIIKNKYCAGWRWQ